MGAINIFMHTIAASRMIFQTYCVTACRDSDKKIISQIENDSPIIWRYLNFDFFPQNSLEYTKLQHLKTSIFPYFWGMLTMLQ
jgi:hypothetical protein